MDAKGVRDQHGDQRNKSQRIGTGQQHADNGQRLPLYDGWRT